MRSLTNKPVLKPMVLSKKDELNLVQSDLLIVQVIEFLSARTPEEPDQILAQISDSFHRISVTFSKESAKAFENHHHCNFTSIRGSVIALLEYRLGLHTEAEATTCHIDIMKFNFLSGIGNVVTKYPPSVCIEPEVLQWLEVVNMGRESQSQLPKFTADANTSSQNPHLVNDSELLYWETDKDDNSDEDELGEDWWTGLKELTDSNCRIPSDQQAILDSLEEWKLPEEEHLTESSLMFTQYTCERYFETQLDSQLFVKIGEGLSQHTTKSLPSLLPPTVSSSDDSAFSGFNSFAPPSDNSLQAQIPPPPHVASTAEAHPDPPSSSGSDHSDGSASSPPDGMNSVGRFDSRFDSQSSLEFVDADGDLDERDPGGDAPGESVVRFDIEIDTRMVKAMNDGAKSRAGMQAEGGEGEGEGTVVQIVEEEFVGTEIQKLTGRTNAMESAERDKMSWMRLQDDEPLLNSDHVVRSSQLLGADSDADSQASDFTICLPSPRNWSGVTAIPASGSPALASTQNMMLLTQTASGPLGYESEDEEIHVPLLESPQMEDEQRADDGRLIGEAATVRDLLEDWVGQKEDENDLPRGGDGIVMDSQGEAEQVGEEFELYIASTQETVIEDRNEQDGKDFDGKQKVNTRITREPAADRPKKIEQDATDAVHTQDSAGSQTQIAAALLAPDSIAGDDDNDPFTILDFSHGSDLPRLSVLEGRSDTRTLGARLTPSEKDEMEAEEGLLVSSMGSDTIIVPTPQVGVEVARRWCSPVEEADDESSYSQYLETQMTQMTPMTEEGVVSAKESLFVGSSMPEEAFGWDEIGASMSDGVRRELEVVVEVDERDDGAMPITSRVETERHSNVGLSLSDKANTEIVSSSRDYVGSPTSPRSRLRTRESSPKLWVEIPVRVPTKKKFSPPSVEPSVTPSEEKTAPQPKKRATKKAPQRPRQTARLRPKPAPAVPPQIEYDVHSTTSSSSLSSREPSPSQEFIGAGKFRKKGEVEGEAGAGTEAKAETVKKVRVLRGIRPTSRNGAQSASDGSAWSGDNGSLKLSSPVQNVGVGSPTPRESDEEKDERIESTAQEIIDSIVVVVPRGQMRRHEKDASDTSSARKKVRWESSQVEDDKSKEQQQQRIVARPKRKLVLRNLSKLAGKMRSEGAETDDDAEEDVNTEVEQDPDWVERVKRTEVQKEEKHRSWLGRKRKQKTEEEQGKRKRGRPPKRLVGESVEAKKTIAEFSNDVGDEYEALERPHTRAAAARSIVFDMNAQTKATPRKAVDSRETDDSTTLNSTTLRTTTLRTTTLRTTTLRTTTSRTNSEPIPEELKKASLTPAKTQTDTSTHKRLDSCGTTTPIPSEETPNCSYDAHGSTASTPLRIHMETATEGSEPAAPSSISDWIAELRAVPGAAQKAKVELEFGDDPEFPLRVPRRPLSIEVVAGVLRNARRAREEKEM